MARIKLDPTEDTVAGRLEASQPLQGALAKRIASQASQQAKSRGLGRSSIAVGAAMGGLLDQQVNIATTDSNNSVQAKIASAQNETSLGVAHIDADSRLLVQQASDKSAAERLAASLESQEREGSANRQVELSGQEVQREGIAATRQTALDHIASTEGLAAARNALDERLSQLQIDARTAEQLRQIASTEGMAAAQLELERYSVDTGAQTAANQLASNEKIAAQGDATDRLGIETQAQSIREQILSNESLANDRNLLDERMQQLQLTAAEDNLILEIASREGIAAAQQAIDKLGIEASRQTALDQIESTEGLEAARNSLTERMTQMELNAADQRQLNDIASREGMAAAQRSLDETIADQQRLTQLTIAREGNEVAREDIAARQDISQANITAADTRAQLDRDNQRFIQSMSISSQVQLEEMRQQYQVDRDNREEVAMSWNNLQQGIANIDPNASATSQQTQFNRLMDTFDSRMSYLSMVRGDEGGGPITTPGGPSRPDGIPDHVWDRMSAEQRANITRGTSYAGTSSGGSTQHH